MNDEKERNSPRLVDAARDEMELSGYSSREATDEQLEEWAQRLENQARLSAYDGGVF